MSAIRVLLALVIAVAPAAAARAAPDTDLGRLFFSPAERTALERARTAAHAAPAPVAAPLPAPAAVLPEDARIAADAQPPVTLNGYVQRSKGPATVWINGVDSYQGDLSALHIDRKRLRMQDGRVRLETAGSDAPVALKPGQTFSPATRDVTDAYEPLPTDDAPPAP